MPAKKKDKDRKRNQSNQANEPKPSTSRSLDKPKPSTSRSLDKPKPSTSRSLDKPKPSTSRSLDKPKPSTSRSLDKPKPRNSSQSSRLLNAPQGVELPINKGPNSVSDQKSFESQLSDKMKELSPIEISILKNFVAIQSESETTVKEKFPNSQQEEKKIEKYLSDYRRDQFLVLHNILDKNTSLVKTVQKLQLHKLKVNIPKDLDEDESKEFCTAYFAEHLSNTHSEIFCQDCSNIPRPFTCNLRCAVIHSNITNIFFWLHNPANEYFHGSNYVGIMPQHIAAMFPTPFFFEMIRTMFSDVTVLTAKYDTPLIVAVKHGFRLTVQYLLDKKKASPNISNVKGETPLMIAIKNDRLDIVQLLYKHQAFLSQSYVNSCFNLEREKYDYLGDYIYKSTPGEN